MDKTGQAIVYFSIMGFSVVLVGFIVKLLCCEKENKKKPVDEPLLPVNEIPKEYEQVGRVLHVNYPWWD